MLSHILIWLKNILIVLDQAVNVVFFGGYPDETISSRCYRWNRDGKYTLPMKIIDTIFFFDKNHCQESYESEKRNRQNAPEFRT